LVNGVFPARARRGRAGNIPHMSNDVLERIDRRLEALGLSPRKASIDAGLGPDAIRDLKRKPESSPTLRTLSALAPVLRTTVAWLAEEVGPEDPEGADNTIPVWGQVGAGGAVFRFHDVTGPIDRIPAPEDSNSRTAAVEITGDSLGPLFDKWYAVYDEVRDPPTKDLIGQLCIVETNDNRVMIKKLKKGRGKRFTLESNYDPPLYDVEVKWAAPVKNLVPR
jgi:SOS-response transcriptional repressor LexA